MAVLGKKSIYRKLLVVVFACFTFPLLSQSLSIESLKLTELDSISLTSASSVDYRINNPSSVLFTKKSESVMVQKFDYLKAYHDQLGVFCKAENKASRKATVNLRMRLGSLDYVNRLEGKIR